MDILIVSSDNKNKIEEIKIALKSLPIVVKSKSEVGLSQIIVEENEETLEGNALKKAQSIYDVFPNVYVIADDTGLFVEELSGEPGVFSARYAGEEHNDEANKNKLIKKLQGTMNRKAFFETIIACITPSGEQYLISGKCNGTILENEKGSHGFGYDSLFQPKGETETFAEMSIEKKNQISHRGKALKNLTDLFKRILN